MEKSLGQQAEILYIYILFCVHFPRIMNNFYYHILKMIYFRKFFNYRIKITTRLKATTISIEVNCCYTSIHLFINILNDICCSASACCIARFSVG